MADSIKFIRKVVILSFIIIILLILLNQLYVTTILEKKRLPRNQQQFIEYKNNNDLKVIVLGDSLASFAFNPAYFNNSFNLATPAENLEQTYYKVKWLVNNEPDIETYIIQYNYHAFNYYRIKPYYFTTYWKNFMSYEELSEVKGSPKSTIFFEVMVPVIGKGEEIIKYIRDWKDLRDPKRKRWLTTKIENGWINDDTIFPEDRENTTEVGRNRAYNQFKNYPIVRDDNLTVIFFDTLKLLEDNNKTIVVVKFPKTDEYLTAINKEVNLSKEYEEIEEGIKSFNNAVVLDYLEMYRHNQTLFVDSDHLNYKGAEILTKELYSLLGQVKLSWAL